MLPHSNAVLKATGITKKFPGITALDSVAIDIYSGCVNAIVGENGAGKSTLMNILSGIYQDYEGQLYLDGQPISFRNAREAQA
ncbi:ATP-binding cassette domain-containing protein, partial [candidate division KSB1 bacterium]